MYLKVFFLVIVGFTAFSAAWQKSAVEYLLESGKISQVAVCSLNGDIYAKSSGFDLTKPEVQAILLNFNNPDAMLGNGIIAAGVRYFFQAYGDGQLIGRSSRGGLIIQKTTKTAIIVTFNDPYHSAEVNLIVGGLVEYLKSNGV